jgi:hypothetical protein
MALWVPIGGIEPVEVQAKPPVFEDGPSSESFADVRPTDFFMRESSPEPSFKSAEH